MRKKQWGLHLALFAASLAGACRRASPKEVFATQVLPVLEGRCLSAACHGVSPDAEARGEVIDPSYFFVQTLADLRVADPENAYASAKRRINTGERPEFSTLLRKPLALEHGGVPHLGGTVFSSPGDPAYRTLLGWIASESGGGEGGEPLSLAQEQFGRDVLPILESRQCLNSSCHGASSPLTGFDSPVVLDGTPVFPAAAIKRNRTVARLHLHLGGDPKLSRLLRKILPLDRGGIPHRGGNDLFLSTGAEAATDAITAWAEQERKDLGFVLPSVEAVVFVRGPLAAQTVYVHDAFVPGTDLMELRPASASGSIRNLTAAAHPLAPADVRDPAVSHDALRVAFSMRRTEADAHNIYELRLSDGQVQQLTFDAGALPGGGRAANVQPTYGPDGRIYFISTRAGTLADGIPALDTEVWAVDPENKALERWTYDPAPQLTPSFIGTGKSYGTLAFTSLRNVGGRFEGPVFRTPLDHNKAYHGDPEIHVHHGVTLKGDIVYGMGTLPDGRFVATLVRRGDLWRGGRPVVFERQFGPELPEGAEGQSSPGGFQHAFSELVPGSGGAGKPSAGFFRRLAPLPDGRVLLSHAPGPGSLDAPTAAPALSLYIASLVEDRVRGPRLGPLERLTAAGTFDRDPVPVVRRPPEDDPSHVRAFDTTHTQQTGILALRHLETLEALFAALEPRGGRRVRTDLAFARLVEWVPSTPSSAALAPASARLQGRTRVLAEVPLAGGSLVAKVPADRPFRVQVLNADRMAVGAQHNRWIHVAPGERFPGGVTPVLYPTLCAPCHGALESFPTSGPTPDVITMASVTLATHLNENPRMPLAPTSALGPPIEIDFRRDIQPLLARSCTSCHAGATPAGSLDLEARAAGLFDTAYEALLAPGAGSGGGRRYVDEVGSSAYQSHLTERIYGRELGAPKTLTGSCPGKPPLSDDERLRFVRWMDLGAAYRGVAP
jgi:hypothetical protein